MESRDLEHFSEPRMLKVKGDCPIRDMGRMIDPYLLQDRQNPKKWWCFYKQNGVSMSYTYDMHNWVYAGCADAGENICVVQMEEKYYMFHSPQNGIGILESDDCLTWKETGQLLTLGQEHWSWAKGRITAGFVMELPAELTEEKTWLMFFHGSGPEDERTMFDQYASIGIAWSHDLITWEWGGKDKM